MSQGTRTVEASLPEARSSPTPVLLMGAERSGITELWAGRMRWLEGWSLAGLSFPHFGPQSDHPYFVPSLRVSDCKAVTDGSWER